MSAEYQNQDPIKIAEQAERDLNSYENKTGNRSGASDSTNESGVDENATTKFPGSEVTYGSAASGAGDNRDIPESEGGDVNPTTGQQYKARDFEGVGGPEDKEALRTQNEGGEDDVRSNTRQQ
nr:hypothetical protein CFP56_50784 [Quercus suber]